MHGQLLALNAGSSSLKLGLFDISSEEQLAQRQVSWDFQEETKREPSFADVLRGLDLSRVAAVGHRVVHGGTHFSAPVLVTASVRNEIEWLASLAPLHNWPALAVIDQVARLLPDVPQVAVFDTAFHTTLPPHAYLYALPYAWFERWGVRRFGFHGLSHAYCAERASQLLGRPLAELELVTCHLGSGCSLAAVAGGCSVATTMGFTPIDGLMMGSRPGSVDPGLLMHLLSRRLVTLETLDVALQQESGLKGVSGLSGDMREIISARAEGHERATLAFDLFVSRLREGIASMATHLHRLDALVFTAGIGEGAPEIRTATCAGLGWMEIDLNEAANAHAIPDVDIGTERSGVSVLVIHTREDLMVARQTRELLGTR